MTQPTFPNDNPPMSRQMNYQYWKPPPFSSPPPNFVTPPPQFPQSYFSRPPPRFAPQPVATTQRQLDETWVTTWLARRNKAFIDKSNQPAALKIGEAKQLVISANKNLQTLRHLQESLEQNLECDHDEWNEMVSKIEETKEKLVANVMQLKLEAPLRRRLKARTSKRKAQHRQRTERQKARQAQQAARQTLHLQIDEWMGRQQQQVEREKRDENIKKNADAVLGEVRQKQSEGSRWLQLLSALTKLRKLRAQAAADKGLHPSENENAHFDNVTGKLMALWQSHMEDYAVEEQTLKVMLEEEEVARHGSTIKPDCSHLQQWECLLFGPPPDIKNTAYAEYMRANFDLQELIKIRSQWDGMIVAPGTVMSSAPPVGWVTPAPPSCDNWASLLSKQNQ